jgi:hypothetical protein
MLISADIGSKLTDSGSSRVAVIYNAIVKSSISSATEATTNDSSSNKLINSSIKILIAYASYDNQFIPVYALGPVAVHISNV